MKKDDLAVLGLGTLALAWGLSKVTINNTTNVLPNVTTPSVLSDPLKQLDSFLKSFFGISAYGAYSNNSTGGWTNTPSAGGFGTSSSGGGGFTSGTTSTNSSHGGTIYVQGSTGGYIPIQPPQNFIQALTSNQQIANAISANTMANQNIVGGEPAREVITAVAAYLNTLNPTTVYDAIKNSNGLYSIDYNSVYYTLTVLKNAGSSFDPNNYINQSYADAAQKFYGQFPYLLPVQYLDPAQAFIKNLIGGTV